MAKRRIVFWVVAVWYAYTAIACTRYQGLSMGYRTLGTVRDSGQAAELAMAEWVKYRAAKCRAEHGPKTSAYATCLGPVIKTHKAWVTARDAINAANLAALGALRSYHAYLDGTKGGKKADWIKVLRPSVCALARALKALIPSVPKLRDAERMLSIVEGVTCGE